ncbi:Silent information regulator protein Sir2 [Novacetimonas hansenii ATCC 23769]|uniref:NAD-dependent protein deacylase n=2 Tax=Novacetimonas hansenii TaxID=436 RepID=D5QD12_NOVHA|nr:Silent information regulator protein Sir2 [Novacetimonas hansenii ATCC 23769]
MSAAVFLCVLIVHTAPTQITMKMGGPMQRIVVLTGAGISQESGLQTFRGEDGLWNHERIADICTPEGFTRDPMRVDRFYNGLRAGLADVQPNAAHRALAHMEECAATGRWDGEILIVTQNIDDLHERAGSRDVVHMHGELMRVRCTACGATPSWHADCLPQTPCPACHRPQLRPDIVWFGEIPYHMDRIAAALQACDLFVAIGTSGVVYPAAGFVQQASPHADTMEFNLQPSAGTDLFDQTVLGPATKTVSRWVRDVTGT